MLSMGWSVAVAQKNVESNAHIGMMKVLAGRI
jgi:hypothetical protein